MRKGSCMARAASRSASRASSECVARAGVLMMTSREDGMACGSGKVITG